VNAARGDFRLRSAWHGEIFLGKKGKPPQPPLVARSRALRLIYLRGASRRVAARRGAGRDALQCPVSDDNGYSLPSAFPNSVLNFSFVHLYEPALFIP